MSIPTRAIADGPTVRMQPDGRVLAACVDEETAWVIAWCINNAKDDVSYHVAPPEVQRVQEFFA